MARRARGDDEGVSLFPFLSVIACVIGVLTLLISALALAQMGSNEQVASLEQYEKVQKELKEVQEEIERLRKQVGEDALRRANEMNEKQRELAAANQRLEQLLQQIIELRKLLAQLNEQAKGGASEDAVDAERRGNELARLRAEIERLKKDVADQKERLAQLDKELEERNKPPVESEVSVLPSGSGLGFVPVFVECTGGSVVIHDRREQPRILATELAQNETFLRILTEVAASPKKTVVFLIRENGLGTYRAARDLANVHEARNGKLPVIGKGRLNLSHFSEANGS